MEETLRDAPPADGWREALAQKIEQQRRKIGERIAGQRERLRELESRIAAQLAEATGELTKGHEEARQAARQATDQMTAREAELKLREQSLAARHEETQRQRRHIAQRLRAQKKELAAEAQLLRAEAAHQGTGQDHQWQLKLAELQGKYDRLREESQSREGHRDELTQRLAELKTQIESRQHEARQQQLALEQAQRKQVETESERAKLHAEFTRHLEESRRQADTAREEQARRASEAQAQAAEVTRLVTDLERVRREAQEQIERFRADQGQSTDAQVQSLQQQLDESRKRHAAEEAAWQKTRQELEKQAAEAKQSAGSKADAAELAKLRDENKQLEAWLAEAEEKAKHSGSGDQEMDDVRRRFEMAVQDVRELKTKNAELTEQLARAKEMSPTPAAQSGQAGDWESLKQKLLADLETDFDEADEGQKADKLTVQGTIKITDQVVTEKEHEIQELRRLLESQAQQVGEVAVGAAAVAQMLDTDELIRQERDSLKRLQDSLREQLRQAEVDISVERAKLARERAELDEKLRGLEAEKANLPAGGGEAAGDRGKKPGGRKWLARLGLGENKEE